MAAKTASPGIDAAIWSRVIQFEGKLAPAAARALLKRRFSARDERRMHELAAKARAGELSPAEQVEIDTYERLGAVLDILHSKARRALGKRRTAS
jgi:hypothetical protein